MRSVRRDAYMEDCAHIYLGRRREKERKGKDKRKRTRRKGKAPACAGCNATAAMLAGCNAVVESPKSAMHSQERRETERRSGRKSSREPRWKDGGAPTRKRDRERTRSRWIMLNACLNTCTPRDTHGARESRRHRAPFVFSIYIKSPLEWPDNGSGRTAPVRCVHSLSSVSASATNI